MAMGTSVSFNKTTRNFIKFPSEIRKKFDVYLKTRVKDRARKFSYINEAYTNSKNILLNFDNFSDKIFKQIFKPKIKKREIKKIVKNIQNNLKEVSEEYKELDIWLTTIHESFLSEPINPIVYFLAKKHYILAKIAINSVKKLSEDDILKIVKSISEKSLKENSEWLIVGVFIGLEPIFVSSLIIAGGRRDYDFISSYNNLINRYLPLVSRNFIEDFLKETEISKNIYGIDAYHKFVSELQVDRHERCLL